MGATTVSMNCWFKSFKSIPDCPQRLERLERMERIERARSAVFVCLKTVTRSRNIEPILDQQACPQQGFTHRPRREPPADLDNSSKLG